MLELIMFILTWGNEKREKGNAEPDFHFPFRLSHAMASLVSQLHSIT
jgi:hypothetical protein